VARAAQGTPNLLLSRFRPGLVIENRLPKPMGRAGIEPATLGLKAPVRGLGASRVVSRFPPDEWDLRPIAAPASRVVSARLVATLLPPPVGRATAARSERATERYGSPSAGEFTGAQEAGFDYPTAEEGAASGALGPRHIIDGG
jgi:hypothetical protein